MVPTGGLPPPKNKLTKTWSHIALIKFLISTRIPFFPSLSTFPSMNIPLIPDHSALWKIWRKARIGFAKNPTLCLRSDLHYPSLFSVTPQWVFYFFSPRKRVSIWYNFHHFPTPMHSNFIPLIWLSILYIPEFLQM